MHETLRVVIDTAVVLQAALRPAGPAGRLLSLVDKGVFTLCLSDASLEEYEMSLGVPLFGPRILISQMNSFPP